MKKTAKNGRGRASEGDWSPIDGLAFSRDALTAWRAQSRENRAFARAALRDRPSLSRLSYWVRRGAEPGRAIACSLGFCASVFLTSARGRSTEWWDGAASWGQDISERLPNGWGFEHLAVFHKNKAALAWWSDQGGRADRATAQGNTVWSLAWEGGGEMLESLERLWPEGTNEAARNGLAQLARFLEGAGDDNDEPNYLRRFYFAGSLPAMLEALGERPEAVGARARLSSLLDSLGRGGSEEFYWARRLEQEAGCEEERVILEGAISTEGLRSGSRAGL